MSPGLVHVPRAPVSKLKCENLCIMSIGKFSSITENGNEQYYRAWVQPVLGNAVTAGLLFIFTNVKLRGPNKNMMIKKNSDFYVQQVWILHLVFLVEKISEFCRCNSQLSILDDNDYCTFWHFIRTPMHHNLVPF